MPFSIRTLLCAALLMAVGLPSAQAQFAVVDIAAGLKLVSEIQTLQQQLSTLQSHLAQARSAYAAITGPRGMEQLLGGTVRNYLSEAMTKVGAMTRVEASRIARAKGWL